MKRSNKHIPKFQINLLICFLVVAVFTLMGAGAYYYLTQLQITHVYISPSELAFYSVFLIMSGLQAIYQLLKRNKDVISVLLSLFVIVFAAIAFFLHILISDAGLRFVAIRGVLLAMTLLASYQLIAFIQFHKVKDTLAEIDEAVSSTRDVIDSTLLSIMAGIFLAALPFVTLQENGLLEEKILLAVILLLFNGVIVVVNAIHLQKHVYVGNEKLILEYKGLALYLKTFSQQTKVVAKQQEQLGLKIEALNAEATQLEEQKHELMLIESNKPEYAQKVDELAHAINQYDLTKLLKQNNDELEVIEQLKKVVWNQEFAEKYDVQTNDLEVSQQQQRTVENELTTLLQKAEMLSHEVAELEEQIKQQYQEQDKLKIKTEELVHKKQNYNDEIINGALEKKEIEKIQDKITKIIEQETQLDQQINKTEIELMSMQDKKDIIYNEYTQLQKSQIPDLQYIIKSITDKIQILQQGLTDIQNEFQELIKSDAEITDKIAQQKELQNKIDAVNLLITQKEEYQQLLDVEVINKLKTLDEQEQGITDSLREIDQEIKDLDSKLALMNQTRQEFYAQKVLLETTLKQ